MESYLKISVICLFASTTFCSLQPHNPDIQVTKRSKRDTNPSWRYTQYQISVLQPDMATYDLSFCQGNPFAGIQCPEERKCASWDEVCNGRQTCALEFREHCLNQSRLSFGTIDERVCDGDENERWCGWKLQAPQRCGKDYVIREGHAAKRSIRIYSPNWPKRYTDDRFCYWTIVAPVGHRLSVRIKKFKTERNFDYISIGNGLRYDDESSVIIFKHSGRQKPSPKKFNTKANKLWISFRSDDWENDKGFYIEVTDTLRYDAGVVGRNPFRGNRPNKDCGEDITLEASQDYRITSPGYPEPYDDNMQCIWVIRMPRGRRMSIIFEAFDLEDQLDYLSLGNGDNPQIRPLIYKHSGRTGPANLTSNENVVWVKFVASLAIARDGFSIKFVDLPYTDCGTEDVTIKTLSQGVTMSVASPNYPDHYGNYLDCVYRFQAEEGRRLLVRLRDFSSERDYDKISLGNGFDVNADTAILWEHSGQALPDTAEFVSDGPVAWIYFHSDMIGGDRGFLANVFDAPAR